MAYRIVKDDKTGNSIVVPKVTKFVYKAKLLNHIDQNKLLEKSETQNTDVEIEIVSLPENTVVQEPTEKQKENSKQQIFKCQEWGFNFDVPTLAHIATKKIDPKIVQIETQKSLPETVQETENKEKENPKQQKRLIFKCHRCHKVLDSAFDLKLHLTRSHDTDQEFEKKLNDFQSLPEASLFRCLKCSFRTNASDQMISHHVEKHVTILQQ
jgi:transposase-like protein